MSVKGFYFIVAGIVAVSTQDTSRPNIVVFQPDDMPFYDHWGPPGNAPRRPRTFTSPGFVNMERIREEGVHFQNAWVTSPACGTSRYATLRGVFASRSERARARTLAAEGTAERVEVTIPNTKLSEGDCENNVASRLRGVGYRTGLVGKWHLADTTPRTAPATYADAQALVTACGFDFADGLYMENFASGWLADSGHFSHNMEWVAEKAIAFVDQAVDAGEPFMLYFNPTTPHEPNVEEALTDFTCTQTPDGDLGVEPVVEGMTAEDGCVSYRATVLDRASESRANQRDQDLGCIWADDALGALLSKLEARGVMNNTLVAVMMDHGIETKNGLFENGNRIAHFVRFPPLIAAGTLYEGHVTNLDLARTILDVAGAVPDYDMDGVSWLESVSSFTGTPAAFWTDRCLFFENEFDRAAICGCFKLLSIDAAHADESTTLERATSTGHSTEYVQLYNLCSDSSETDTLQASEFHADTLAMMQCMLGCHEGRTAPSLPSTFTACGPTLAGEAPAADSGCRHGDDSALVRAGEAGGGAHAGAGTGNDDQVLAQVQEEESGASSEGSSVSDIRANVTEAETSSTTMSSSIPPATHSAYLIGVALAAMAGN